MLRAYIVTKRSREPSRRLPAEHTLSHHARVRRLCSYDGSDRWMRLSRCHSVDVTQQEGGLRRDDTEKPQESLVRERIAKTPRYRYVLNCLVGLVALVGALPCVTAELKLALRPLLRRVSPTCPFDHERYM